MKKLTLLIFLLGCYTPLDNVSEMLPKNQRVECFETVEDIKKYYFTDEACEAIKDIPSVDGVGISPWVTGVNVWTYLLGAVSFQGFSRKVVAPRDYLETQGTNVFVHEYIHHLDDMTRDGEGDWISIEEFREAYKRMADDKIKVADKDVQFYTYKYADVIKKIERKANHWITDTFGIGELSEHIAYMAGHLVRSGGPEYMWHVYRKVLRRHHRCEK